MIRGIDHINIVVAHMERSVRFYTELLGFEEVRRAFLEGKWIDEIVGLKEARAEVVYLLAPAGEPRLELLCYESPSRGKALTENSRADTLGLRHLALRVDDIETTAKRLREAGFKVFSSPVTVPSGIVDHTAGEKTLCYFLDPDGVLLELAQYD